MKKKIFIPCQIGKVRSLREFMAKQKEFKKDQEKQRVKRDLNK